MWFRLKPFRLKLITFLTPNSYRMRATIISVVLAILIIAGGVAGSGALSSQKKSAPRLPVANKVAQVTHRTVKRQALPTQIEVTGRLTARDRVEIFAEVSGTYVRASRAFKEGNYFKEGETMIRIQDQEFANSIKAQKSALAYQITLLLPDLKTDYPESFPAWEAYLKNFDIEAPLVDLPEPRTEQERYFISARNLYNQFYTIRSQDARAEKYEIEAPFSGKVATSAITEGTLIRTGQKLGEFFSSAAYEMEAAVSLKDLAYVQPGGQVSLRSEDLGGTWTGRVIRISDAIDPNTQTVRVFVFVSGRGLKEGMYLEGTIKGRTLQEVVEVNRNLLLGDSTLYVITDMAATDSTDGVGAAGLRKGVLKATVVEPVQFTSETAFVKGLEDGVTIVNQPILNAYDGMKVIMYESPVK